MLRETRCGWARSKEADLREDAEMERICEIQSFVVFSKSQHVLPQPIFKRSEAESEKERGFERDVVSFAVAKELPKKAVFKDEFDLSMRLYRVEHSQTLRSYCTEGIRWEKIKCLFLHTSGRKGMNFIYCERDQLVFDPLSSLLRRAS